MASPRSAYITGKERILLLGLIYNKREILNNKKTDSSILEMENNALQQITALTQ